jgi:hypothetical protein
MLTMNASADWVRNGILLNLLVAIYKRTLRALLAQILGFGGYRNSGARLKIGC